MLEDSTPPEDAGTMGLTFKYDVFAFIVLENLIEQGLLTHDMLI
jgi:hypothetical protein